MLLAYTPTRGRERERRELPLPAVDDWLAWGLAEAKKPAALLGLVCSREVQRPEPKGQARNC